MVPIGRRNSSYTTIVSCTSELAAHKTGNLQRTFSSMDQMVNVNVHVQSTDHAARHHPDHHACITPDPACNFCVRFARCLDSPGLISVDSAIIDQYLIDNPPILWSITIPNTLSHNRTISLFFPIMQLPRFAEQPSRSDALVAARAAAHSVHCSVEECLIPACCAVPPIEPSVSPSLLTALPQTDVWAALQSQIQQLLH